MQKPTYDQLLSLVQYLAVRADYENLPLRDEPKSAVEFCLQKPLLNAFDFDDEQKENIIPKFTDAELDLIYDLLDNHRHCCEDDDEIELVYSAIEKLTEKN